MKKNQELKCILFIGYFLSSHSLGRCVCEELSSHFLNRGYKIVTASNSPKRMRRIFDIIITILTRRNEYQVAYVEVYNGLAFLWAEIGCTLLHILRKPYVITLHGARLLEFSKKWPLRFKHLLQKASCVTTPSKKFRKEFSKWRPDILYLPNAINLNDYPYTQRIHPTPNLGWLRKFEHNYNPLLAIQTLAMLVDDFPSIKLIMSGADLGDGSLAETMETITRKNLMDHVQVTGFIDRSGISAWFSQSDIYINTTTVESFGIAVMEAAAAGLCIITTSVGELPHLWIDEEEALLVPSNDPQAMAVAVRRILTEPGLASRLSKNAHEKAMQYDWSVIIPQWESLFKKINNLG